PGRVVVGRAGTSQRPPTATGSATGRRSRTDRRSAPTAAARPAEVAPGGAATLCPGVAARRGQKVFLTIHVAVLAHRRGDRIRDRTGRHREKPLGTSGRLAATLRLRREGGWLRERR